ncbi:transposase, partial [Frankia tisae]
SRPTRYPPRFRAHAVASVALARPRHSSTWAAIKAVAASLAISTETLRTWVRQAESSGSATGPADTCGLPTAPPPRGPRPSPSPRPEHRHHPGRSTDRGSAAGTADAPRWSGGGPFRTRRGRSPRRRRRRS